MFHSLRELMKRRDDRLLNIIVLMLEDGRLSDEDALALLRLDEQYSLSMLNAEQPTSVNLRLLSGLLRNKIDFLAVLSNEKITELTKAEKNPETIKTYLGILVERESKPGVEYIMELFQNGLLLGDLRVLTAAKPALPPPPAAPGDDKRPLREKPAKARARP